MCFIGVKRYHRFHRQNGRLHALERQKQNTRTSFDLVSVRVSDFMRQHSRETRGRLHLNPRPNAHGITSLKRERRKLNHRLGGKHAVLLVRSHRRREKSHRGLLILLQREMVRERYRRVSHQREQKELVESEQSESARKRTLNARVRSRHFTRLTGSVDVLRVRDGEKRQSETNVFVFRFFRRGSAGGFV